MKKKKKATSPVQAEEGEKGGCIGIYCLVGIRVRFFFSWFGVGCKGREKRKRISERENVPSHRPFSPPPYNDDDLLL